MKILHPQYGCLLTTVLFTTRLHCCKRLNNCKMTCVRYEWTNKWQMKLNVDKCAVLRCTRSQTPIQYVYTLIDCNLHVKKLHMYFGVEIDNTMSWSSHIQTVSNRATKVFNFVKRNLGNCPASTKRIAYLTLVRPIMEYAASVWDPFYNTDIYKLEKIQRRAA